MEKDRFKQLIESTMGNVKPLITEETTLGKKDFGTVEFYNRFIDYVTQLNLEKGPYVFAGGELIFQYTPKGFVPRNSKGETIIKIPKPQQLSNETKGGEWTYDKNNGTIRLTSLS